MHLCFPCLTFSLTSCFSVLKYSADVCLFNSQWHPLMFPSLSTRIHRCGEDTLSWFSIPSLSTYPVCCSRDNPSLWTMGLRLSNSISLFPCLVTNPSLPPWLSQFIMLLYQCSVPTFRNAYLQFFFFFTCFTPHHLTTSFLLNFLLFYFYYVLCSPFSSFSSTSLNFFLSTLLCTSNILIHLIFWWTFHLVILFLLIDFQSPIYCF